MMKMGIVLGAVAFLAVALLFSAGSRANIDCPPDSTPAPLTAPPYLFPLEQYGRWVAVPQCYKLHPSEFQGQVIPCDDPQNDKFPRSLYSVHGILAHNGKIALWSQTYGLSTFS